MAKRKTRRKKTTRKRSRAGVRSLRAPRLSEMSQAQLDAVGLGLIALGVFFGFLFYGGWAGGKVGEALSTGLTFALGTVAYTVPVLLALSGLALIVRPLVEEPGHPRIGATILVCALTLGFAAGTLGLGPGAASTSDIFDPDSFMDQGGLIGAGLYWLFSTLFSLAGAHIAFVAGVLGGLLVLTGTSLSALARSVAEGLSHAARVTRARFEQLSGALSRERDRARSDAARGSLEPEEPEGEPRVMALAEPGDQEPDSFAAEIDALGQSDDDAIEAQPGAEPPTAERAVSELTPMGNKRTEVTESDEIDYKLPEAKTLRRSDENLGPDTTNQEQIARTLVDTLGHFGVEAAVVGRVIGPRVTRHELRLAPGIKMAKVSALKDDLAYALASTDIRILAPIPGKQAVGVEVPNKRHRMVFLGDIFRRDLGAKAGKKDSGSASGGRTGSSRGTSPLAVWLGKDIAGHAVWTDLARMPHVLVAGATGSGKSGCVNAMLCSILLRSSPNDVRLVLVDPKRVELNHYEGIPHLLTPVVTNPRMAANVLGNLIGEMESRYEVMGRAKSRSIVEMNKLRAKAGEPQLPHILCVIDELADLMMIAPSEVEDAIIRLAQKSRAVGIHLVLATQRPSVDIITGTIKVNIPVRIAFAVSSQHDSRVILDGGGAEALLGQGDMLFRPVGSSKLQRIQGAYVTEEEVARITDAWRIQGEPVFEETLLEKRATEDEDKGDLDPNEDDLLVRAITLVAQTQTASVSMLQRRLRVGYTRAGRLIDMLERRGAISGYEGSKPRQVLITEGDVDRVLGGGEAPVPAVTDGSDE